MNVSAAMAFLAGIGALAADDRELVATCPLVVVDATVGEEIFLDSGFLVGDVEVDDLWITDVEIADGGRGVVVFPTQVGVVHLFVGRTDGWVIEYELTVSAKVEKEEEDEEEQEEDWLIPVSAVLGTEIALDPGFTVSQIEVSGFWIGDVQLARRGSRVTMQVTELGSATLYVSSTDGVRLGYEVTVSEAAELPECPEDGSPCE